MCHHPSPPTVFSRFVSSPLPCILHSQNWSWTTKVADCENIESVQRNVCHSVSIQGDVFLIIWINFIFWIFLNVFLWQSWNFVATLCMLLESILIRKKSLRRIKFVLIKFSLHALLYRWLYTMRDVHKLYVKNSKISKLCVVYRGWFVSMCALWCAQSLLEAVTSHITKGKICALIILEMYVTFVDWKRTYCE